jgi:hypothetical protein
MSVDKVEERLMLSPNNVQLDIRSAFQTCGDFRLVL